MRLSKEYVSTLKWPYSSLPPQAKLYLFGRRMGDSRQEEILIF